MPLSVLASERGGSLERHMTDFGAGNDITTSPISRVDGVICFVDCVPTETLISFFCSDQSFAVHPCRLQLWLAFFVSALGMSKLNMPEPFA